jgi:hypothetical protein
VLFDFVPLSKWCGLSQVLMAIQLYHDLVEIYSRILAQVQNQQSHHI